MTDSSLRPPAKEERQRLRAMALDIGRARIGVAVLDVDTGMALADSVLARKGTRKDIARLMERQRQLGAEVWIVGLPPASPDPKNCTARLATNFARALVEAQPLPVWLVDEADTSREAKAHLGLLGIRGRRLKSVVDKHAAARILDRWTRGDAAIAP